MAVTVGALLAAVLMLPNDKALARGGGGGLGGGGFHGGGFGGVRGGGFGGGFRGGGFGVMPPSTNNVAPTT